MKKPESLTLITIALGNSLVALRAFIYARRDDCPAAARFDISAFPYMVPTSQELSF